METMNFKFIVVYLLVWQGMSFLHDTKSVENILKSFFFIPLDGQKEAPFYGYAAIKVGWTLNYEMFFYLLLTICLVFGRYRYAVFSSVILVLLLLVPLVFKGNVSLDAHHHYYFRFGYLNLASNPIIWDFVCGMLLGGWYIYRKPHWQKSIYYILLSVFAIWTSINLFFKWNSGHGMTHWALPILGLVATLIFYENQYGLKVPKWLMFLGKISFSVYLLHPVAQYYTEYFFNHHNLARWNMTPVFILVSSLLTLCAATVTQFLIENHFSGILKKTILFLGKKIGLR